MGAVSACPWLSCCLSMSTYFCMIFIRLKFGLGLSGCDMQLWLSTLVITIYCMMTICYPLWFACVLVTQLLLYCRKAEEGWVVLFYQATKRHMLINYLGFDNLFDWIFSLICFSIVLIDSGKHIQRPKYSGKHIQILLFCCDFDILGSSLLVDVFFSWQTRSSCYEILDFSVLE